LIWHGADSTSELDPLTYATATYCRLAREINPQCDAGHVQNDSKAILCKKSESPEQASARLFGAFLLASDKEADGRFIGTFDDAG